MSLVEAYEKVFGEKTFALTGVNKTLEALVKKSAVSTSPGTNTSSEEVLVKVTVRVVPLTEKSAVAERVANAAGTQQATAKMAKSTITARFLGRKCMIFSFARPGKAGGATPCR
jgi:hypothetical protein